jgi:isopenicillin N synthase-like dioxygenase
MTDTARYADVISGPPPARFERGKNDPVQTVPSIDLTAALAGDPAARVSASESIDDACRTSGFLIVTGHGVPKGRLDDVIAVSRRFFALPSEVKALVAPPGPFHFRGHLAMDTTSLAATLGEATPPDLCESFNVSRFDDPAYRASVEVAGAEAVFCPNQWPAEPAELRPCYLAYFAEVQRLAFDLLALMASALGLPDDWFVQHFEHHTSLLMANWYPPVTTAPLPGQLRRGAHTDYGAFTIVAVESIPGLQIHTGGGWEDIPIVPDGFVVNLGDLMARWTNDRWVSTLHRVVVPPGGDASRDRVSIPFFFQPTFTASIATISTTITPDHPARYQPVISGEWIAAKSMAMLDEAG